MSIIFSHNAIETITVSVTHHSGLVDRGITVRHVRCLKLYTANNILGPILRNVVVSYRLCCVYYTPGTAQSFRLSVFHAYPFIFSVCCIWVISAAADTAVRRWAWLADVRIYLWDMELTSVFVGYADWLCASLSATGYCLSGSSVASRMALYKYDYYYYYKTGSRYNDTLCVGKPKGSVTLSQK